MEVAQRASKALRFGLDEIQPDQPLTNAERIMVEFDDLLAVVQMCQERALLPYGAQERVQAKKDKVAKFLNYSRECGTVSDTDGNTYTITPLHAANEDAHIPFAQKLGKHPRPSARSPIYVIAGDIKHGVTFPVDKLTSPDDRAPPGYMGVTASQYRELTGRSAAKDYRKEMKFD